MPGVSKYDKIEDEVESDEKEVFADDGHILVSVQYIQCCVYVMTFLNSAPAVLFITGANRPLKNVMPFQR